MLTVINRAHYVEVRKGRISIFRKAKPPDGGIARHLLTAFKIPDGERGVYALRHFNDSYEKEILEAHVREINELDGRVPSDQEKLNKSLLIISHLNKEVEKVA